MESETLQPKLQEAQKALQVALDQACGVDLREVDTGELIRIEETLVMASKAAKEAVSVRLKLRSQRARTQSESPPPPPVADTPAITHRVFDDIRGKRWHSFAVRPSTATVELAALPEAFRNGWVVFESTTEVRRLAPIPDNWEELSIEDLRLLCHQAAVTPKRPTPSKPGQNQEPPLSS